MRRWLQQLPRPRVRLWMLLVLVALVAVVAGGWRALQRRHEAMLRREYYRAIIAELESAVVQLDGMATGEEDMARKSQEFARRLRAGTLSERQKSAIRTADVPVPEHAEARAADFARMASAKRRTLEAITRLLPEIRQAASRAERGDDPRAKDDLRRLLDQLP